MGRIFICAPNPTYRLANRLNQALAQSTGYRPWPGFRHPCRNDGLIYKLNGPAKGRLIFFSGKERNLQSYPQSSSSFLEIRDCRYHRTVGQNPLPLDSPANL